MKLTVNGTEHEVKGNGEIPILWYVRDLLGLSGTKYGCGIDLCGSCTVHLDGVAMRGTRTFADPGRCRHGYDRCAP